MLISYRCSTTPAAKSARSQLAPFLAAFLLVTLFLLAGQCVSWARYPGNHNFFSAGATVETATAIPAGTVLPLRLDGNISLKDAQKGQTIAGKITQDVPLPGREKIPAKSAVKGSIVSVEREAEGGGVVLTLKFHQLETRKEALTISTYLRVIASYDAVRVAQTPHSGADVGTPTGWADTIQIGGDSRFGDGGEVRGPGKKKVGKGVIGGVLVHVLANPARGCEGPVNGDDHLQALWVFSANACGVYDLNGIKISHSGKSEPVGEFSLHFEKDDMRLEDGTAMLLRIVPQP
jgi:hypothetical protein